MCAGVCVKVGRWVGVKGWAHVLLADEAADGGEGGVGLVRVVAPARARVPEPELGPAHFGTLHQHIGCRACRVRGQTLRNAF